MKKTLVSALVLGAAALLVLGIALAKPSATSSRPVVRIKTNLGVIEAELFPDKAPATVDNFLEYVAAKQYDGTIFHRVIKRFMIQGGGFTADYKKKKTRAPVRNEADNGLSNVVGTLAMARTSDPHSATAQFFINTHDNKRLDHQEKSGAGWGYCVFGKVTKGMDVVRQIEGLPTGPAGPFRQNAPRSQVVIESIALVTPVAE